MSADQEHVARMANVALTGLKATLRRQAKVDGGVAPLPIVDDAVLWLTTIANSVDAVSAPALVHGSGGGTAIDIEAVEVTPSTVDVATAAQRLGISVRAVRKRCEAGTLPARKVGPVWLINLEAPAHV